MADPFLAEIRIMSFVFAPKGWAKCDGQLLPINQNQPLFALLGTMYGGNGQTTFALPDLRGRTPIHFDDNAHTLAERGGEESHTISIAEMPAHTHVLNASATDGNAPVPFGPSGNILARTVNNIYASPANLVALNPGTVTNTGGSQPHENMQPFLTLNFCIALIGIFPSRNN